MPKKTVDIKENALLKIDSSLLSILLKDMTTGKNILWATDNYVKLGPAYAPDKQIKLPLITGRNGNIIKPRVEKSKAEQQHRVRQKAEVFTPAWVCNIQCNAVDEALLDQKDVFSVEKDHSWETTKGKIPFPFANGVTWQQYVFFRNLEITCGEAPYIASRYDSVSGEYIEVPDRIGMLDRKLRVISENTEGREDWIKWAFYAVQSTYGYEWQGDNLLIARENVLFDVEEHYEARFGERLSTQNLLGLAEVIVWNILQMDGLKFVVPDSCHTEEIVEENLFERRTVSKPCEGCKKRDYFKHNGIYCIIKDWRENETLRFVDMLKKDNK